MKSLILLFAVIFCGGALGGNAFANPLAGNVPEDVSRRALALLVETNKTITMTGDVHEGEKLADLLTDYVLGLSVKLEVRHACKTLSSDLMVCQLSAIGRRSEEFIDYKLNVSVVDKSVEVLSLYENFVTVSRGGP